MARVQRPRAVPTQVLRRQAVHIDACLHDRRPFTAGAEVRRVQRGALVASNRGQARHKGRVVLETRRNATRINIIGTVPVGRVTWIFANAIYDPHQRSGRSGAAY